MKEILLLFATLLGVGIMSANAQQAQIDSLENLLSAKEIDIDKKATLLLELAKLYEIVAPQKALGKAKLALDITIANEKKDSQIEALNVLGAISIKLGDFVEASDYYHKALEYSEKENAQTGTVNALNGLGTTASYSKNFNLARNYFERNLEFCDSLTLIKEKVKVLSNLSHVYQNLGEMQKALQLQKESIAIGEKYGEGKLSRAKSLLGIANIFGRSGQSDSALVYLQLALIDFQELNDYYGVAISYATKGNIARRKGNLQTAVASFDSARFFYKLIGNEQEVAISSVQAGEVLTIMGYPDKAVSYLKPAVSIIRKGSNKRALLFAYQNYAGALSEFLKQNEEKEEEKNIESIRDSVILLYTLSAKIAEELGDKHSEGLAFSNIGLIYSRKGDCEKAIPILLKGIKIRSANASDKGLYNPYLTLSRCYINTGAQQDAMQCLEIADSIATSNTEVTNTAEFYLELAKAYAELGAFEQSNNILFRYVNLRKQYYDEHKATTIAEIEEKYQGQQRELEIQTLEKEKALQLTINRNQRLSLIAILLGTLGLGVITYLSYKRSQYRKRTNQLLSNKNEKIELLHRELSHRVKNNLAFVSSLMRMQARRLESKEAKQAVKEGEARIEAMSLLHRKLYLQENATVETSTYLKELCSYLQHSFPSDTKTPTIEIDAQQLKMNGEDAMRLGLIINELITNSFKYAFTEQEDPVINIQLSTGTSGAYQLFYKDNGKGLPSELEMEQNSSLGLKLIHTLTRQLNGQIKQYNDGGACFQIAFEEPKIVV